MWSFLPEMREKEREREEGEEERDSKNASCICRIYQVSRLYLSSDLSYTCNAARNEISITETLISIISPAIRAQLWVLPFPPPTSPSSPHHLLPSVLEAMVDISADHFVIYGESLASRLSDEATGTATVGDSSFGPPHPAALASSLPTVYPAPPLPPPAPPKPFRFPLSLFPSFARISRIAIFAGR